ncbi:MAG: hypothetical protein HPY53_04475 [Brevinematales bacterium]|nr:hypothetical protein [Brevinematales bacterium]
MRIFRGFSLSVFFSVVLSSCAIFHFFQPGMQNNIQQLADKKGWVLLGQAVPNAAQSAGDFSFDVSPAGVPTLVTRDPGLNVILYQFDGNWKAVNSVNGFSVQNRPILQFVNGNPTVAMKFGDDNGEIYNFGINPAEPYIPSHFGSNFSIFDFKKDHSETLYTAFDTNSGMYGLIISCSSNNNSWTAPAGYGFSFFTFPITYIKLDFSADNHPFVLWSTNNFHNLTYQMNDNSWTTTSFGFSGYYFHYGISPDNKMFLIYQNTTNTLYYDIFDLSAAVAPTLYTQPFFSSNGCIMDSSPFSVAVSKTTPPAAYILVHYMTGADTVHSILKLNEDGSVAVTPNIPEMNNSGEAKLYAAPDGSIYLLFNFGWTVYVYRWVE